MTSSDLSSWKILCGKKSLSGLVNILYESFLGFKIFTVSAWHDAIATIDTFDPIDVKGNDENTKKIEFN